MSPYIVISLLFLLGLVSSNTCPTITCGVLTSPNCYKYDEASNTGIASECLPSEYCDLETDDNGMIRDDDDSPLFHNANCAAKGLGDDDDGNLPGQPCDAADLCTNLEGVSCIDSKCEGLTKDQACFSTKQCNPGLYCKTGATAQKTCSELIKKDKSCVPGEDICEYGYECDGKCRKMFSVDNDDEIPGEVCNSGFSTLCEKGFCITSDDSTLGLCLSPPKNEHSYDKVCDVCTGQIEYKKEKIGVDIDCECALNGNRYCPGFPGDEYASKLFGKAKEFYFSSAIKKCNVETEIFSCMIDYWSEDNKIEFAYYLYMSTNRMFTYKSDKCVLERLGYVYLTIKAAYDSIDDSSSSSSGLSWLIFGSAWALIA